jgi:hypothetical protein
MRLNALKCLKTKEKTKIEQRIKAWSMEMLEKQLNNY